MVHTSDDANAQPRRVVDAVVVGAGFAGLYMLHRLREMGLTVVAFEAGASVGGTWYWNRYPGARCDTKSLGYCYSFSEELWRDWEWTEEYAKQDEIERYINHVADRLELRRDIYFNHRVVSAVYDEHSGGWEIATDRGASVQATYCFMATGGFSAPIVPAIDGLEGFKGELYYTSHWPDRPIDFTGKRVGVIGTGSSGMQTITEIGQKDTFAALYVFQRTPNFAVPGRNRPLDPEDQRAVKARYAEFWGGVKRSGSGFEVDVPVGPVGDLADEEFERRMDAAYAKGGPTVIGWVTDLLTDDRANRRVADYLRRRMRDRVEDPRIAELLTPHGYHIGSRRQLVENGYLEVFNNPKVKLVDVKTYPITRITSNGIETRDRSFDLDVIVLATGFDSGSGAVMAIGPIGVGGLKLRKKWIDGPRTYLGLMTAGFPNLFVIAGPGSPSIRSVVTVSIEQHVEWLSKLVEHMRHLDVHVVDATTEAEDAWTAHVAETAGALLLSKDDTQYFGSNVPGKPRVYLAYLGGVLAYRSICERVANSGYEGFRFLKDGAPAGSNSPTWSGPISDGASPVLGVGNGVI